MLVSGGAGFIGSRLCTALAARGSEVHALTRSAPPEGDGPVRWWQLDLADPEATRAVIGAVRPDTFYHLASHVVGARDLANVWPSFRDNALTTVNALVALSETGCGRCVLAGSLEEPDMTAGEAVPSSPYAAAKAASTLYGNLFSSLYGLPVTRARIFMVYGPGQTDLRKVVPFTIRTFLDGRTPRFASLRPVDWIYVDDVVDGLIAAAATPDAAGRTVDLGSGEMVTVRDLILTLADLMHVPGPIAFEPVEERAMEQVRRADAAATRALTGWSCRTGLREGLGESIRFYETLFRKSPSE